MKLRFSLNRWQHQQPGRWLENLETSRRRSFRFMAKRAHLIGITPGYQPLEEKIALTGIVFGMSNRPMFAGALRSWLSSNTTFASRDITVEAHRHWKLDRTRERSWCEIGLGGCASNGLARRFSIALPMSAGLKPDRFTTHASLRVIE
jgi:hypothetical protein